MEHTDANRALDPTTLSQKLSNIPDQIDVNAWKSDIDVVGDTRSEGREKHRYR